MTIAKHVVSASVPGLPGVVVLGGTVYSTDFESGLDSWTGTYGTVSGLDTFGDGHSGTNNIEFDIRAGTGQAEVTRTVTGLTIGAPYTLTAWLSEQNARGPVGKVGVLGIGYGTPVTLTGGGYYQLSYTFTATATSHALLVGYAQTVATANYYDGNADDILLVRNTYTTTTTYPLHVISSTVTLDEYAVPYAKGDLVCSIPALSYLDQIDPRLNLRVSATLTTTQTGTATVSRPMNLALTDRALDFVNLTMTLSVASDEAVLDNYALVATASTRTYGLSVKTAVTAALATIGATLGGTPADFTLTTKALDAVKTNVCMNPRVATASTGWVQSYNGGGAGTQTLVATGGPLTWVPTFARTTITTAAPAPLYFYVDQSVNPVAVLTQYTGTMWVRSSIAQSVIVAIVGWTGTAQGAETYSPSYTLAPGVWTQVSGTFTTDGANNGLRFHIYTAASTPVGATLDITGLVIVAGSTAVTDYFDGSTSGTRDSTVYVHAWTGTANASTSTLTEQPNNDGTVWNPGTSAYDWVSPLVQTGGLRLWCDETRVWHLDTSTTTNSTFISMAAGTNITDANETISLTSGEWYSGVVVQYNWTTADGLSHISYDSAGNATGRTLYQSLDDTPYPGPGAAAAILTRASNKGRQFSVTGMPNFTVTPTGALLINLPNDDIQSGITSSVTWSIPAEGDASMSITSRGLITIPLHSWLTLTESSWATIAETSWPTLT
jgi:hypothetical protein